MISVIFFLMILLVAVFVFSIFFFFFSIDSLVGDNDLPTSARVTEVVLTIIEKHGLRAGNFYDLGCCRGGFALSVKKKFPFFSVIGVDNSFTRIFFSRMKNMFSKNKVRFVRGDLFRINVENADIVYTYLPRPIMARLEEKLTRELKTGAMVITNTTFFPNWKPVETITVNEKTPDYEKVFVYIK